VFGVYVYCLSYYVAVMPLVLVWRWGGNVHDDHNSGASHRK
jgi:hypothetical protein